MGMSGQFGPGQGYGRLATKFANRMLTQSGSLALVQRGAALKVGEAKGGFPVATIERAEQRKERRVLGD
jgi:hypothetical protein